MEPKRAIDGIGPNGDFQCNSINDPFFFAVSVTHSILNRCCMGSVTSPSRRMHWRGARVHQECRAYEKQTAVSQQ